MDQAIVEVIKNTIFGIVAYVIWKQYKRLVNQVIFDGEKRMEKQLDDIVTIIRNDFEKYAEQDKLRLELGFTNHTDQVVERVVSRVEQGLKNRDRK